MIDITKAYTLKVQVPLFGFWVTFKYDQFPDLPEDQWGGYDIDDMTIWLNKPEIENETHFIQVLAHESCHCAMDIIKKIAQDSYPSDTIGEELFCWLVDGLVGAILDSINRGEVISMKDVSD